MTDNAAKYLSTPISVQAGQPLRVALYTRIAEAVRNGTLAPGSLLPTETELGSALGVSRTVVREALMLLEEDGLIYKRRGVGRFVCETVPDIGIDRIHAFEQILGGSGKNIKLARSLTELQPSSIFVAQGLGLEPEAEGWIWESVVSRDGEPIALLQEHIAAGKTLANVSTTLAARIEKDDQHEQSLLATINSVLGPVLGPGKCEIGVGIVGESRAKLLSLRPTDPVLVLTQFASHSRRPFYLAKCLVTARAGHLSVMQAAQS